MGISRSMDAVAAAARFVGCAIRQVTSLQTRVPHRNNSGGLDWQEAAPSWSLKVTISWPWSRKPVEEATTLSSEVATGGQVLEVASRAWLHPAIDVANTRQRHDPAQTDTAQRACTPVARHVNPSHCQGYSVLTLRACTRTRGACVRRGEV